MNINCPFAKIAANSMMRHGKTEAEAIQIIEQSTFEQVSSQIGSTDSIITAARSIGEHFGLTSDEMNKFILEISGIDADHCVSERMRLACSMRISDTSDKEFAGIIVDAMSDVHNRWILDNADRFDEKATSNKAYQYLPLEIIGWKDAIYDLRYISEIASFVGFNVSEDIIRDELNDRAQRLLERNGVDNFNELVTLISQSPDVHQILPQSISEKMGSPSFVESVVIPSIATKGFGADAKLMEKLEQAGISPFDGTDAQVISRS